LTAKMFGPEARTSCSPTSHAPLPWLRLCGEFGMLETL
jgi:hypothetical protein